MAGIPTQFRKSGENVLASYDYIDVAAGTGIIKYYAGIISGATLYKTILSSEAFYSDPISSLGAGATLSISGAIVLAEVNNKNFDLFFNLPRTIKGDGIITLPLGIQGTTANRNYSTQAYANLYKWDGITQTFIVSGATAIFYDDTTAAAGKEIEMTKSIYLNVPQTHFKKGEYLRLNITQYGWEAIGSSGVFSLGHDPKNRYATLDGGFINTIDTILIANIPFKIDL